MLVAGGHVEVRWHPEGRLSVAYVWSGESRGHLPREARDWRDERGGFCVAAEGGAPGAAGGLVRCFFFVA